MTDTLSEADMDFNFCLCESVHARTGKLLITNWCDFNLVWRYV